MTFPCGCVFGLEEHPVEKSIFFPDGRRRIWVVGTFCRKHDPRTSRLAKALCAAGVLFLLHGVWLDQAVAMLLALL